MILTLEAKEASSESNPCNQNYRLVNIRCVIGGYNVALYGLILPLQLLPKYLIRRYAKASSATLLKGVTKYQRRE